MDDGDEDRGPLATALEKLRGVAAQPRALRTTTEIAPAEAAAVVDALDAMAGLIVAVRKVSAKLEALAVRGVAIPAEPRLDEQDERVICAANGLDHAAVRAEMDLLRAGRAAAREGGGS